RYRRAAWYQSERQAPGHETAQVQRAIRESEVARVMRRLWPVAGDQWGGRGRDASAAERDFVRAAGNIAAHDQGGASRARGRRREADADRAPRPFRHGPDLLARGDLEVARVHAAQGDTPDRDRRRADTDEVHRLSAARAADVLGSERETGGGDVERGLSRQG